MKKQTMIIAALLGAMTISGAARGQSLLDQQLGPTTPAADRKQEATSAGTAADAGVEKPADKPAAAAQAEKKAPVAGAGGDIVSTEAAKKVDDDELLKQLLQPDAKPDPNEVARRLQAMIDRMKQTVALLNNKDPGEVTQETQRRIITDLDVMIELARQQQQQQSSSSSSQPQEGQQRQPGQPQGGQQKGEGGNVAAASDPLPRGGHAEPKVGDMHSRDPANWGGLPPRDRDQVSHGANEDYLNSYKDLIDRYYQALAEMGRSRGR